MKKEKVYNLKVCSFSNYYSKKTMEEILNDALQQAKTYAIELKTKYPNKIMVLHAALSVGTTWILHKTQKFE